MLTLLCLVAAGAVGVLIMSDRFKDGIVIKAGLICISVGFIAAASSSYANDNGLVKSIYAISIGTIVVIFGAILRGILTKGQCRRTTDWFDQPTVTK